MSTNYTARKQRNEGRKSYSVSFRHPLKQEKGKQGRKVCKGLGTDSDTEADRLVAELNKLLASPELHSVAGKQEADRRGFDERVIDIFYEGLDSATPDHRAQRDQLLELPKDGYTRTLLLGVTGAGKTTLLRRLIDSDPERDRFPSTSINRTTTCEIEVITGGAEYQAAVTFLSQHQTQQEVIESLSAAVLEAVEKDEDERVLSEFLEQSDMRFRLKYILGDLADSSGEDEFSFAPAPTAKGKPKASTPPVDPESIQSFLKKVVTNVRKIANDARKVVEDVLGRLDKLEGDDRDYALDEIQQEAEQSDAFLDLVSEILAEIQARFEWVTVGSFVKSSTGWPKAWTFTLGAERRSDFMDAIRWFSGNAKDQWGQLLTPLVTGIRVKGPFQPSWAPKSYRHVFIDTEGLLHAKANSDVPSEYTSLFKQVDMILLVESAENALHSPVAAKVFEAVSSAGYTANFAVLFTHMDEASGENLQNDKAKKDHVFGGIRNVLDNQVAKNVSRDAARHLENRLQKNTFYFAYLNPKKYPTDDEKQVIRFEAIIGQQLKKLVTAFSQARPELKLAAYPDYSMQSLALAVREGSLAFVEGWDARLGYKRVDGLSAAPWQSIKALSRRYAEGWLWDSFRLRPIDNFTSVMRNVVSRFLDSPMDSGGELVTDAQKAAIIDSIKKEVNEGLAELAKDRLQKVPLPEWQAAYGLSGKGSTYERKFRVRSIFRVQVPVPESISDKLAQAWIETIEKLITQAVDNAKRRAKQV